MAIRIIQSLNTAYLYSDISQCSDICKVWWDVRYWRYYKFTNESGSERIMKIGSHLAKLLTKVWVPVFIGPPCKFMKSPKQFVGYGSGRVGSEIYSSSAGQVVSGQ